MFLFIQITIIESPISNVSVVHVEMLYKERILNGANLFSAWPELTHWKRRQFIMLQPSFYYFSRKSWCERVRGTVFKFSAIRAKFYSFHHSMVYTTYLTTIIPCLSVTITENGIMMVGMVNILKQWENFTRS